MRVLFAFNSRVAKHGSFEDFMLALSEVGAKRGWEVEFAFPEVREKGIREILERRSRVWMLSAPLHSPLGIKRLKRLVRDRRPDLVNTHFCDSTRTVDLFWNLRRWGVKGVYHYHGEILPLDSLPLWKKWFSSLRLRSIWMDHIVTVSKANERFLRFHNVLSPISVVYNGISCKRFLDSLNERPNPLEEWVLRAVGGTRFLVYLGSLNARRKRIRWLLEVFKEIRKRANVRLVVMGDGDVFRYQAICRELGIEKDVIFTGLVEEYPYRVMARADVFVSASEQESFGLVFAEALLLGTPVVACKVGGIPEVVIDGKSGILVEAHDQSSFVKAVLTLLEREDLREQMAQFGRSYVMSKFELDDRVNELFDLFESI